MEDISIFLTIGAGILAAIVLVWNAVKAIREAMKPIAEYEKRLNAVEETQLDNTKNINSLYDMSRILLKGEVLIASHITEGNHKEQIKQFSDEVNEYLINNV